MTKTPPKRNRLTVFLMMAVGLMVIGMLSGCHHIPPAHELTKPSIPPANELTKPSYPDGTTKPVPVKQPR